MLLTRFVMLLLCVIFVLRTVACGANTTVGGDTELMQQTYLSVFRLRDGSQLAPGNTRAQESMRAGVKRLLGVTLASSEESATEYTDAFALTYTASALLLVARSLPDEVLLRVLFLAVAGDFAVDRSPSAISQKCAIVADAGTGVLVFKDMGAEHSVIMDVLLIMSIVFLLRVWGVKDQGGGAGD